MKGHVVSWPPHPEDEARVLEAFQALSDATRVRLVLRLSREEHAVGDLVEALDAPQSTVSRHLAVLRKARLVATRREGTSVYYRLAGEHARDLVREAFSHAEHERLQLPDEQARPASTTEHEAIS